MKFIGITGGVGAGKSTVLAYLEAHCHCKVVLADDLAKSLMEPGSVCYEQICQVLAGRDVFGTDGRLDAAKMARVLFSEDDIRSQVNAIVHPAVKQSVVQQVEAERRRGVLDYFFFEAALLIEEHYDRICDELWYIYADEDCRRARLKESRGYTDEKVDAIFASQLPEAVFRQYCQKVIDNQGTPEQTAACLQSILGIGE